MVNIPVSSIIPAAALFYGALASEKAVFKDDFIEFGLSPASLNLISQTTNDKLKPIETEFVGGKADSTAVSIIIDENFFNSVFASLALIDKMYSLR